MFFGEIRPDVFPHFPRDFAMELADAVGVTGEFQGQNCHTEHFVGIAGVLRPRERNSSLDRPRPR